MTGAKTEPFKRRVNHAGNCIRCAAPESEHHRPDCPMGRSAPLLPELLQQRIGNAVAPFQIGDKVVKVGGSVEFMGVVTSITRNDDGKWCDMNVMSLVPGARRLKHIYRPNQFRLMTVVEQKVLRCMLDTWELVWPTITDAAPAPDA